MSTTYSDVARLLSWSKSSSVTRGMRSLSAQQEAAMRITIIGRGRVGGGLTRRWQAAGHDVTALGRDGGDATGADILVVAVPGDVIATGLTSVRGLDGQITIDATNRFGSRPEGLDSVAHQVKSI